MKTLLKYANFWLTRSSLVDNHGADVYSLVDVSKNFRLSVNFEKLGRGIVIAIPFIWLTITFLLPF